MTLIENGVCATFACAPPRRRDGGPTSWTLLLTPCSCSPSTISPSFTVPRLFPRAPATVTTMPAEVTPQPAMDLPSPRCVPRSSFRVRTGWQPSRRGSVSRCSRAHARVKPRSSRRSTNPTSTEVRGYLGDDNSGAQWSAYATPDRQPTRRSSPQ